MQDLGLRHGTLRWLTMPTSGVTHGDRGHGACDVDMGHSAPQQSPALIETSARLFFFFGNTCPPSNKTESNQEVSPSYTRTPTSEGFR